MTSMRIPALVASALLALLSSACTDSRPASPGGSASNAETCVYCHGSVGRAGNLPGTDPLLPAAPPSPPNGKPAAVVGAHQAHLNPPVNDPLSAPIACSECHVVPQGLGHATNPPANPIQFGVLARAQGASPTYEPISLGCAAVYCHGNFDINGVTGSNAAPLWTDTAPLTCTSCHGLPPTNHPALTGTVTAATCSQCHPDTVNANGTINVAGRRHINGQADLSGGSHTAGWASPTQHGYSGNKQGLQNCETCHIGFGPASGVATSSCNACHASAGHANWQNECTFCHGTPNRPANVPGTDAFLAASPPVGPQGQTASTDEMVGAHQKHVNPAAAGQRASPFACTECHASPLPTGVAHANGLAVPVPFGGIAITGDVRPTFDPTTLSCSATYCHGNFSGGKTTASPLWTGGAVTCTSCHNMPTTSTGEHSKHMGSAINCSECHSGIATGTGDPSTNAAIVAPGAAHVNGTVNVVLAPTGSSTITTSGSGASRTCNGNCHGKSHGSERW